MESVCTSFNAMTDPEDMSQRASSAEASPEFDVVVYGASGFTGRLVAEYLASGNASVSDLRWAVAGRNAEKLKAVVSNLGQGPSDVPILVADSGDAAALDAMARRTRVVLSTVGPYARYGSELVAACAKTGTSYCDLTGEVQWMRAMIDAHQATAESSGARIVHACGFDSIPSDIGVWFLQQQANERYGTPCENVRLLVRALRGGFSGGTAASLLNAVEEGKRDREIARILVRPYSLNPEGERDGPDGRDQSGAVYNEDLGVWTSPFVMALINMRVVRRSNALMNYAYGRDFSYSEATSNGPGIKGRLRAIMSSLGLRAFMVASAIDFTREKLVKPRLPASGTGPSKAQQESGFFKLVLFGRTAKGETLQVSVTGDRDPGYGSTSKMISESAICLARDELAVGGGIWTPASAMAVPLIKRLRSNAGVQFEAR